MHHHPRFNPKLESLRGVAALTICFTHSIAIYCVDNNKDFWMLPVHRPSFWAGCLVVLNAIFSPGAAVILFFILSGYVLTQSLKADGALAGRAIFSFYLRRAFRILPMMWAALFFTYALSAIGHTSPPGQVTDFYLNTFEHHFSLLALLRNFFLLGFQVSPVMWTMRIELLGSLLMPAIVYVLVQSTPLQRLLVLGVLAALACVAHGDFEYVVCFYVGALLNSKDLVAAGARRPALIFFFGLAICTVLSLLRGLPHHRALEILATTLGAAMILLGVLAGPSKFGFLESGPFRLVGRLSYSLYLLHPAFLGLFAVVAFAIQLHPLLSGAVANTVIFVASTIAALGASVFTYQWIEQPSMKLGKQATQFASHPPPVMARLEKSG